MKFFNIKNNNKKKNKKNDKIFEKLKEEYSEKTLFYLNCKEALKIIQDNYKSEEIIITDNINYNYVIDNTLNDNDSHNIAELIHYSIDDLSYSSFYLDDKDTYSYSFYDNVIFDTTNYFIRIRFTQKNIKVLIKNLENLRQEHIESFKNINDY